MKKPSAILFFLLVILQFTHSQGTYTLETKINDLKTIKYNENDVIKLANSISSDSTGNPMLPYRQLKVAIPSNNEVISISIVSIQEQEITGEYNIVPVEQPSILGVSMIATTKRNELIYNSDSFYPIKPLNGIDYCLMSGVKIYSLSYYPIRYNPVTKKIKVITSITFRLNYTFKQQESVYSSNLSQKSYDYIAKHIKNLVINPSEVETNSNLMIQKSQQIQNSLIVKPANNTVDYVIITNESLKNGFQEIADWKIKTGLNTKIVTTEWISQNFSGSDLQEKIRMFIKYAFQNWGSIWYLLGGGNQIVPVRYAWVSAFCNDISQFNPNGVFIPSDMYYACLDGNWNADGDMTFGEGSVNRSNNGTFVNYGNNIDDVDRGYDVNVGRIPVENNTDLTHFKTKYFEYLRGIGVNASKALVFAQNSVKLDCEVMNPVAENFKNTTVDKLYECAGDNQSNCGTKQDVLNAFNSINGYHIICGFGHGNTGNFTACTGGISNSEIDALHNSKRGQILYNNHCETLALDGDCIGEHYMNAEHGGIAYIGYTQSGWSNDPPIYNGQFIWNIYNKSERLGEAFFEAKGTGGLTDLYPRWTFFSLNFLGDPEMPVWTTTPKTLSVSANTTSNVCGNAIITVIVNNLLPNEKALISLEKGVEINTTSTIYANGTYTFNVNTKTIGQIELTVTSQNYIPFEITIPINASPGENLYLYNITIDDDMSGSSHGNDNQQIDAGETIELTVGLRNNGLTTANNVVANISSTSSHISLISNQSNFGTITSNNTAFSITKFVFLVDKDTPELLKGDIGSVRFNLQISDGNGNSFADVFNVDIYASEIKQGNKTIISTGNGNLTIDPNEVVTLNIDLKNIGKTEARGLTAILTGNSSDLTPRSYPNIPTLETKHNTAVFKFTTGATVANPLIFHLQVKNEYQKTWDLPDFNLLDVPNKVNNLNFTADVTTINLSWDPITNPNIQGYNIYRWSVDTNDNESGSCVKLNTNPVTSSFYIDVNLGLLTHYRYKVSSVSQTGNEGIYSDSFLAWTSIGNEKYPLNGGAIRGGIIAADINNDGYKEIFAATKSGYILGLDHTCKELCNISGDITNQGPFALMQKEVWGTPAIADLHGNGQCQLVDASRNATVGYNGLYCFSGNNFKGIPLWRKDLPAGNFKGPILSNIDNSPDGSLEVITACESGVNSIVIYDADGNLKTTIPSNGTYDAIAVADIDDDPNGYKEIIQASGNGIYIWNHDGSYYKGTNPYYTLTSGLLFQGAPIVCDIDNDGKKEILASVKMGSTSKIYAIRTDLTNTIVTGWNTPIIAANGSMSVGDLNHDGKLEIVALGNNVVNVNNINVLNNKGIILYSKTINDFPPAGNPILADLDDDSDIEIVFGGTSTANKNIYLFNMDLTNVSGFPVSTADVPFSVPCVSDIDNDGKNELILGVDNSIYLWRTNGKANNIEWGCDRQNQYNTGEYQRNCNPVTITTNETWSSNHDFCGDLIVGLGTLTINSGSILSMGNSTSITVKSGASLVIDSGSIINANVKAMAGSNVIIKNNGSIKLRSNGEFNTELNTVVDIPYGSITQ